MENINGWLNIDKPLNYSSAKVVAIIKKMIKAKKVGHGGTLDPLATGVLPICINKATKTTEKIMLFDKEYLFNITFGEERTTGDAEGDIVNTNNKIPTELEIKNIIPQFIGIIQQTPPIFSALKINGKRAYELARDNKKVKLQAREIRVDNLEFISFINKNTAQFKVKCGKGFYVRSLGIDLSKALGTLGYISYLRRLSVGIFNHNNITTLEELENKINHNQVNEILLPV